MGKNGHQEPEVIGGNIEPQQHQYGDPLEHWKKDFGNAPSNNVIDKIYHLPEKEDIAGHFIRANIKDEVQADALSYFAVLCKEHNDYADLELVYVKLSSTVGIRGLGRLEALFGTTNVVASDMYRVARNMPKSKDEEKIMRRSDFRNKEDDDRELDRKH